MPTHIRAMVQWNVGSMLPRDVMQITPCFRRQTDLISDSPDWQALADDLALAMEQKTGVSRQITVKLYDIDAKVAGEPNRPRATKVRNANACAELSIPRELACCLSFNGGPNGPRNRGRLYIPYGFFHVSGSLPVRPASGIMTAIGNLAQDFAGLGGSNVDWIVWSTKYKTATKVERWFVDDEYDVQRRRGLTPTARTSGVTSG